MNHSEIIRSVCRGELKSLFMFPVGARSSGRMRTPFGGIKAKPIQRLLLFFALISTAPSVWASCTEGDEKCGAAGYVLTCEKNIYTDEMRWKPKLGGLVECASEREKRHERLQREIDENLEEIERRLQREEEREEARRICEPGLRRCHAGTLQYCSYSGELWIDLYGDCTSTEINRGDHKYD